MSGDVSLAAYIGYPTDGFADHTALMVIRQSLDNDAKEALVALHGDGMIHLGQRPARGSGSATRNTGSEAGAACPAEVRPTAS